MVQIFLPWKFHSSSFDPHSQPCVRNIFSTSFTSQWVEEHTFHGYRLRETAMGYLIWWFATFHASLTDSCLLLTSDTISRAFSCKQTATIPEKTTWESFPHHVHFPTQQNYFQNDAFAEIKPLPPNSMLLPTNTQGSGFLVNTQQHCFQGKGEREEPVQLRCLGKCCPSIQFSQQFCPRL